MNTYTMKTYRDSYLYNKAGSNGQNMMKKHDTALIGYIMKAERIDKKSDQFSGIEEDIKRQQTSSLLYQVLMMDNVYLCIGSTELPPAFKVFEAFDVQAKERKPAVFIDVTKLIQMRNGFYDCKDIGKLITYLMGALTYLLYRYDVAKMMNNSALTISGTECYVAMYSYILDYLRIIGYSANKPRIMYLIGLFYLNNMLGKDLDTYSKNIAAKVAKISPSTIKAMDLFIEDDIFANIDVFTTFLAETFKLKGFTTEVLVNKWIYLFGNGSQYAVELYTSFSVLLTNAFCGAYVSNQKQIERCCGQSMVSYGNALLRAGVDTFKHEQYIESVGFDNLIGKNKKSMKLAEDLSLQGKNLPEEFRITKEDFADNEIFSKKLQENINFYNKTREFTKLDKVLETTFMKALGALTSMCEDDTSFDNNTLPEFMKMSEAYQSEELKNKIYLNLDRYTNRFTDQMQINESEDLAKSGRYAKALSIVMDAK